MEIRTGRHCVFLMHAHLVFVTKYRKKVFTKEILGVMEEIFLGVRESFEAELVEFDGGGDHVHLLVTYPPKVSISKLVGSLKTASSRVIRKQGFPSISSALGVDHCGHPAILPAHVSAPNLKRSNSIYRNRRHRASRQSAYR